MLSWPNKSDWFSSYHRPRTTRTAIAQTETARKQKEPLRPFFPVIQWRPKWRTQLSLLIKKFHFDLNSNCFCSWWVLKVKKVDQELKTRIKEDRKTGKKALELELGTTIQDGLFHFEIWSEIVEKFAWEKRRPCAAFQKCKRGIHEVHGKSIFRVVICLFTFEFDLSTPRVQICFILFFEFFAFSENRYATLDLL